MSTRSILLILSIFIAIIGAMFYYTSLVREEQRLQLIETRATAVPAVFTATELLDRNLQSQGLDQYSNVETLPIGFEHV